MEPLSGPSAQPERRALPRLPARTALLGLHLEAGSWQRTLLLSCPVEFMGRATPFGNRCRGQPDGALYYPEPARTQPTPREPSAPGREAASGCPRRCSDTKASL